MESYITAQFVSQGDFQKKKNIRFIAWTKFEKIMTHSQVANLEILNKFQN